MQHEVAVHGVGMGMHIELDVMHYYHMRMAHHVHVVVR